MSDRYNEDLKTKNKHRKLYKVIVWTTLLLVSLFLHRCAIDMIIDPISYTSMALAYHRIRVTRYGITLLFISYPLIVTCVVNLISLTSIREKVKNIVAIKRKEKCYKRINYLHSYYEKGSITEEEFNNLKQEILNKLN